MMERFPDFQRGRRVSAERMNAIKETVEQLTRGGLSFGVEGPNDTPPDSNPIARITGVNVPADGQLYEYTFQIVLPLDAEDGAAPLHADLAGFVGEVAFERGNNGKVPTDGSVFVELVPAWNGAWIFDFDHTVIFGRLDSEGTGGKYAWTEMYPIQGGGFDEVSGGRTGTTTRNFLQEMNGGTGIPAETIVVVHRGYCSGYPHVQVDYHTHGDGAAVRQKQKVWLVNASAGSFTLTFDDTGANPQTTAAIAWNANAAAVEAALEALSNVTAATVTGAGTEGSPFVVEFLDSFTDYGLMIADYALLTDDQEWLFDGAGLGRCRGVTEHILVTSNTTVDEMWPGKIVDHPDGVSTTYGAAVWVKGENSEELYAGHVYEGKGYGVAIGRCVFWVACCGAGVEPGSTGGSPGGSIGSGDDPPDCMLDADTLCLTVTVVYMGETTVSELEFTRVTSTPPLWEWDGSLDICCLNGGMPFTHIDFYFDNDLSPWLKLTKTGGFMFLEGTYDGCDEVTFPPLGGAECIVGDVVEHCDYHFGPMVIGECEGGGGGGGTGGCTYCAGDIAGQFTLPVAGVTNGTSSACLAANTTYTPTISEEDECHWYSDYFGIAGTTARWVMFYTGNELYIKCTTIAAVDLVVYHLETDTWNCNEEATLDRSSQTGDCNWPATLTVTPV